MKRVASALAGVFLFAGTSFSFPLRPAPSIAPPYTAGEKAVTLLLGGASVRVEEAGQETLAARLRDADAPDDAFSVERHVVLLVSLSGSNNEAELDVSNAKLVENGRTEPLLTSTAFRRQGRTAPWAARLLGIRRLMAGGDASTLLVFRRSATSGPFRLEGLRLRIGENEETLVFELVAER